MCRDPSVKQIFPCDCWIYTDPTRLRSFSAIIYLCFVSPRLSPLPMSYGLNLYFMSDRYYVSSNGNLPEGTRLWSYLYFNGRRRLIFANICLVYAYARLPQRYYTFEAIICFHPVLYRVRSVKFDFFLNKIALFR